MQLNLRQSLGGLAAAVVARRSPARSWRPSSRTAAASTTRCMTIAFGQVFWFIAMKPHGITGGEDGLLNIARLPLRSRRRYVDLAGNVALFYFVLAVFWP